MLVYNVADDDSFAYVRTMREQILAYRATSSHYSPQDLPPIIIAANKADLQASHLLGAVLLSLRCYYEYSLIQPALHMDFNMRDSTWKSV